MTDPNMPIEAEKEKMLSDAKHNIEALITLFNLIEEELNSDIDLNDKSPCVYIVACISEASRKAINLIKKLHAQKKEAAND